MTTLRQIEANRRNARLSTGPVTEDGKKRSRRNALRHGLTAETVIDALEDADDYAAFEMAIKVDYDPQTAVERELVLRLASLLWRLRRASAIERGLFEMGAKHPFHFQHRPYSRSVRLTSLDTGLAVASPARSDTSVDHDEANRGPSLDAASFPLDEQADEFQRPHALLCPPGRPGDLSAGPPLPLRDRALATIAPDPRNVGASGAAQIVGADDVSVQKA